MENNIKVTKDDFVWKVLTYEETKAVWNTGIFDLYVLFNDDTEYLITSESQFKDAIDNKYTIGIEVGYLIGIHYNHRDD